MRRTPGAIARIGLHGTIAVCLAAMALFAASPARAQTGGGWQVIQGTRVYSEVDLSRGIATFSNECGTQTLTQGQLAAGAIPNRIVPCPRPGSGGGNGACPPGQRAERGRCVPFGATLCPNGITACSVGQKCAVGGGCVDSSAIYCANGHYCDAGKVCASDGCLERNSDRVCSNGRACESGYHCRGDNTCESVAERQHRWGICAKDLITATAGHLFDAMADDPARRADGARAEIEQLEAARAGCAEFSDETANLNEALAKARKKLSDAIADAAKRKRDAEAKARRLANCNVQVEAARKASRALAAGEPNSKAKTDLADRLKVLANGSGACAEFMDEETCPTCAGTVLEKLFADLQDGIARDKAVEGDDAKAGGAAKTFADNDPRGGANDPFGEVVGAKKSDDAAATARRDFAANDPRAGGNVFQDNQQQQACGSDIRLSATQAPLPGCDTGGSAGDAGGAGNKAGPPPAPKVQPPRPPAPPPKIVRLPPPPCDGCAALDAVAEVLPEFAQLLDDMDREINSPNIPPPQQWLAEPPRASQTRTAHNEPPAGGGDADDSSADNARKLHLPPGFSLDDPFRLEAEAEKDYAQVCKQAYGEYLSGKDNPIDAFKTKVRDLKKKGNSIIDIVRHPFDSAKAALQEKIDGQLEKFDPHKYFKILEEQIRKAETKDHQEELERFKKKWRDKCLDNAFDKDIEEKLKHALDHLDGDDL